MNKSCETCCKPLDKHLTFKDRQAIRKIIIEELEALKRMIANNYVMIHPSAINSKVLK